jgi:hypothetical protein
MRYYWWTPLVHYAIVLANTSGAGAAAFRSKPLQLPKKLLQYRCAVHYHIIHVQDTTGAGAAACPSKPLQPCLWTCSGNRRLLLSASDGRVRVVGPWPQLDSQACKPCCVWYYDARLVLATAGQLAPSCTAAANIASNMPRATHSIPTGRRCCAPHRGGWWRSNSCTQSMQRLAWQGQTYAAARYADAEPHSACSTHVVSWRCLV